MVQSISSVCVFCSASSHVDSSYLKLAYDFGQLLAKEGVRLVYGGSHFGLMGKLADGCLAGNGHVYGVTTDHLHEYEQAHRHLQELEVVPDMHSRKARMFERSDGIVVLPGGFGTLDETIEVLTWKQIALHDKPIVIVNYKQYWEPLKDLIDNIIRHKFARDLDGDLLHFVSTIEEVLPHMRTMPRQKIDPTTKWI